MKFIIPQLKESKGARNERKINFGFETPGFVLPYRRIGPNRLFSTPAMDLKIGGNRDVALFLREGVHPVFACAAWRDLKAQRQTLLTDADPGLLDVFSSVYQPRAKRIDASEVGVSKSLHLFSKDMSQDLGAVGELNRAALFGLANVSETASTESSRYQLPNSSLCRPSQSM